MVLVSHMPDLDLHKIGALHSFGSSKTMARVPQSLYTKATGA